MPDYSPFIKFFNTALPAPTTNSTSVLIPSSGSADGHSSSPTHTEPLTHTRLADATWRVLVASDASAKEGGKGSASSPNATAAALPGGSGGGSGPAASSLLGLVIPTISVGRMMVSTEDRWRIQAAMRREEVKSGLTRKEYNKKVTRAVKVTKGPMGDGFPVGRGRPL